MCLAFWDGSGCFSNMPYFHDVTHSPFIAYCWLEITSIQVSQAMYPFSLRVHPITVCPESTPLHVYQAMHPFMHIQTHMHTHLPAPQKKRNVIQSPEQCAMTCSVHAIQLCSLRKVNNCQLHAAHLDFHVHLVLLASVCALSFLSSHCYSDRWNNSITRWQQHIAYCHKLCERCGRHHIY